MQKQPNKKAANKAATKQSKKATAPATEAKNLPAVIPAEKSASDLKAETISKLNAVFIQHYPNARAVFGEKRPTPITAENLAKHNPANESMRDTAFIRAIRSVIGNQPFTAQQLKADTGNLCRAIKLKAIIATGNTDDNGHTLYKIA